MSYTVRIYGTDPQGDDRTQLLEEAEFTSGTEALELIAGALGDGYTAELLATA